METIFKEIDEELINKFINSDNLDLNELSKHTGADITNKTYEENPKDIDPPYRVEITTKESIMILENEEAEAWHSFIKDLIIGAMLSGKKVPDFNWRIYNRKK